MGTKLKGVPKINSSDNILMQLKKIRIDAPRFHAETYQYHK